MSIGEASLTALPRQIPVITYSGLSVAHGNFGIFLFQPAGCGKQPRDSLFISRNALASGFSCD